MYLEQPHTLSGQVEVVDVIRGERDIVRLAATWFHPQGGGQKGDRGWIGDAEVYDVRQAEDGDIDHYVRSADGLNPQQTYPFAVDPEWRQLNARYHSGGHLLASVCENLFPGVVGVNGHHWPGEARVEFTGAELERVTARLDRLQTEIESAVAADGPVDVVGDPYDNRAIRMGEFSPIPCGGTHVASTAEIGPVKLRSAKIKSGKLRIGYELQV